MQEMWRNNVKSYTRCQKNTVDAPKIEEKLFILRKDGPDWL